MRWGFDHRQSESAARASSLKAVHDHTAIIPDGETRSPNLTLASALTTSRSAEGRSHGVERSLSVIPEMLLDMTDVEDASEVLTGQALPPEYGPTSVAPSQGPDELPRWRPDPLAPPSYVHRTIDAALTTLRSPGTDG